MQPVSNWIIPAQAGHAAEQIRISFFVDDIYLYSNTFIWFVIRTLRIPDPDSWP